MVILRVGPEFHQSKSDLWMEGMQPPEPYSLAHMGCLSSELESGAGARAQIQVIR